MSCVSVSLEMMDSSLKLITRSPGSGISVRLKFSELFILTAIFHEMERGIKVLLLNITLQHHNIIQSILSMSLVRVHIAYININTTGV